LICLAAGLAFAQKFTREAKGRIESDGRAPVFVVLTSQPQRAVLDRTSLSAAREVTLNRTNDPEAVKARWRAQAYAEIAREVAPQQDRVETLLRSLGATQLGRYTIVNMVTAEVPVWAIQDLENSPDVAKVFLSKTRQAHLDTSVPALGAPTFWNAGFAGAGQIIALVDSGVRTNHPAFAGRTIINRIFLNFGKTSNCFDDDATTAEDKQGHGTHIAGILMSQGSAGFTNHIGVARGLGTLYNVKAGFKAKAPCSLGGAEADDRDLMDAAQWAAESVGIAIVNCSFGGDVSAGEDDDILSIAFDQIADTHDVFVAVSAGNGGPTAGTVSSPGIGFNIVSVGNWITRGSISNTSSRGPTGGGRFKPDIAGPGNNIVSVAYDWDGTGLPDFVAKSGTSMSAPHIAAAAALLRHAGVADTLETKAILLNTTGALTWAADRGWGFANLTTAQSQVAFRDSRTVSAGAFNFYRLSAPGDLTATLTWNRHIFGTRPTVTDIRFNNLDLYAYNRASGEAITQANSTLQNVEKISLNSSTDVVLKVRSAPTDPVFEYYGIAFSRPFSRATGPTLTITCSQPSSGTVHVPINGTCTVANSGDMPAFGVVLNIIGTAGPNSWTLNTIQPGSNAVTNTSFTATIGGSREFPVAASSASYGEAISGNTSFTVNFASSPGAPPASANPNPANFGANIASSGTLSWAASSGATGYDVYFGPANPPPLSASNLTGTTRAFSILTSAATYFWQVVAKNSAGATASPIWRFTVGEPTGLLFVAIAPCRLVDTRNPNGPLGGPVLPAKQFRTFPLSIHSCVAPAAPAAFSLNITVVPQGPLGFLTVWPTGLDQPVVSTLNALDGRIKANAAIVPAGTSGSVNLYATDAAHAIVDINGYFVQPGASNALAFYPVKPCRVADTRTNAPPALAGNSTRSFNVLGSSCGIPAAARAYALNATVVPLTPGFGFLTLWPTGQARPTVSTLNALTGTVTANAAIVPAGFEGEISAYGTDNANLILDINGYFAPAGSAGALTFRTLAPCRVLDTRLATGPLGGPILAANATRNIPITSSACQVPTTAQSYSMNATVVPPAAFGFLTLWAAGSTRPTVSTLNALDGALTSNAAIVPASTPGGAINVHGSDAVHLLLDISGYFAP